MIIFFIAYNAALAMVVAVNLHHLGGGPIRGVIKGGIRGGSIIGVVIGYSLGVGSIVAETITATSLLRGRATAVG